MISSTPIRRSQGREPPAQFSGSEIPSLTPRSERTSISCKRTCTPVLGSTGYQPSWRTRAAASERQRNSQRKTSGWKTGSGSLISTMTVRAVSLKTAYSRRLVPIHSRLIELGILELQPACPDGFMWPADTRTAKNPGESPIDRLQKKLAHRLKRSGVKQDKTTAAHSFRHTLIARLKSESIRTTRSQRLSVISTTASPRGGTALLLISASSRM